jgi:biopolymer transport protein ExbD
MEAMENDNGVQRQRAGVRRPVKRQLRIDMTPMVDLGFLLISFFVITTELSKPTVMPLAMPKDGGESEIGESYAFTVLLGSQEKAWFYYGNWANAVAGDAVYPLNSITELRHKIQDKQLWLDKHPGKEGREGLMVLVKSSPQASYKQVVDVLDEMTINQVKRYAVIKPELTELEWINTLNE